MTDVVCDPEIEVCEETETSIEIYDDNTKPYGGTTYWLTWGIFKTIWIATAYYVRSQQVTGQ